MNDDADRWALRAGDWVGVYDTPAGRWMAYPVDWKFGGPIARTEAGTVYLGPKGEGATWRRIAPLGHGVEISADNGATWARDFGVPLSARWNTERGAWDLIELTEKLVDGVKYRDERSGAFDSPCLWRPLPHPEPQPATKPDRNPKRPIRELLVALATHPIVVMEGINIMLYSEHPSTRRPSVSLYRGNGYEGGVTRNEDGEWQYHDRNVRVRSIRATAADALDDAMEALK